MEAQTLDADKTFRNAKKILVKEEGYSRRKLLALRRDDISWS